ncbi:MAG: hypothetical protein QF681_06545 [Vicinamibacterales bacterium]|nr:hypothetical protein [Vicinamibacterales bacterium]
MARKEKLFVLLFGCIAVVSVAHTLFAFVFIEPEVRWPAGEIMMEMQLGGASGLIDGSADWDECAIAALVDWNANLGGTGVSFNAIRNSTQPAANNDGFNNVFWADDIFGTPFGAQTLAVTTGWFFERAGVDTRTEADVIFNNAQAFNCYRGERRLGPTPESSSTSDMKRTALHEFGHVLGLDHPDQATPAADTRHGHELNGQRRRFVAGRRHQRREDVVWRRRGGHPVPAA